MATMEDKPGERHLFRINDGSTTLLMSPECLSCLESDNTTDTCLYNRAHFSKDFSYFVLECLGPGVPRVYLFSSWSAPESEENVKAAKRRNAVSVTHGARLLYTLDDYNEVRSRVEEMAMPQTKTFKLELEEEPRYTYNVQL